MDIEPATFKVKRVYYRKSKVVNVLKESIFSGSDDEELVFRANDSYKAALGFYSLNMKSLRLSMDRLARLLKVYSDTIGCDPSPPPVKGISLKKMRLKPHPLFRVETSLETAKRRQLEKELEKKQTKISL